MDIPADIDQLSYENLETNLNFYTTSSISLVNTLRLGLPSSASVKLSAQWQAHWSASNWWIL